MTLDSGYRGSLLTYYYMVISDGEITFSVPWDEHLLCSTWVSHPLNYWWFSLSYKSADFATHPILQKPGGGYCISFFHLTPMLLDWNSPWEKQHTLWNAVKLWSSHPQVPQTSI